MHCLCNVQFDVKETLDQGEILKTALTSVSIGADSVERYNSMLQEMLQQVRPIAQQICKFSKGGSNSGFKLRSRCTSRKLEGLSKLRKSPHRVAMQHKDTKLQAKKHAMTHITLYRQSDRQCW